MLFTADQSVFFVFFKDKNFFIAVQYPSELNQFHLLFAIVNVKIYSNIAGIPLHPIHET